MTCPRCTDPACPTRQRLHVLTDGTAARYAPAAATPQPPPVHIPGAPSLHDALCVRLGVLGADVADDVRARKEFGRGKYGTVLQLGNGRDFAVDAYQEVLDALVYCEGLAQEGDDAAPAMIATLTSVAVQLRRRVRA